MLSVSQELQAVLWVSRKEQVMQVGFDLGKLQSGGAFGLSLSRRGDMRKLFYSSPQLNIKWIES